MGVPTQQLEIRDELVEAAYIWADIEESIRGEWGGSPLYNAVAKAFRVEAFYSPPDPDEGPSLGFRLLYDVQDTDSRNAAKTLRNNDLLPFIRSHSSTCSVWTFVKTVFGTPDSEGVICRRLGEDHPPWIVPDLERIPEEQPKSAVPLTKRDCYLLTPIEVPIYDALRETGLTFAVQPRIQGTDRHYRVDFLVFYDGKSVAVELDGHDSHKTKVQRQRDAERDRWFQARRISTLRWTGSEVYRDPQKCIKDLMDVLRGAQSTP